MRREGLPLLVTCALLTGAVSALQVDGPAPRAGADAVTFEDVTRGAGLDFRHVNGASPDKHLVETMGSGGAFLDYDNDGWIDVFLVDGGSIVDAREAAAARHRLYRNRGDGTFEDVTARSGLVHREYGMGTCAADYDNDGWMDLYVTDFGPNVLFHNNGDGTFTDTTGPAGVGSDLWSTSCAFTDVDRDGDVDLFVTNYVDASPSRNPFCGDPDRNIRMYCHPLNYEPEPNVLYRNDGGGVFTDVSRASGLAAHRGNGLGVVVADYDGDGWPDVFVANDAVPDFLFHNEGDGRFTEVGLLAGVSVAASGKATASMGVDFDDYDGDGLLDLLVTNHEFETNNLFRNLGGGLFLAVTTEAGLGAPTLPYVGFGAAFFDYDNDAQLDLAVVNGHVVDNTAMFREGTSHAQRNLLFRGLAGGRFVEVGPRSGRGFALEKVSRTLAVGDLDNDGDLDLLVTNNGQTADLLRNDGGNRRHALLVRLVGRQSNRDGIGATLRLTAGQRVQMREVKAGSSYLGQNDLRVHFGLGAAGVAERLEIDWPSGSRDVLEDVPADQLVTVVEGEGETARVGLRGGG